MDYSFITSEGKIQGLIQRVGSLETNHYKNEIYLLESGLASDNPAVQELIKENKDIESAIVRLWAEVTHLENPKESTDEKL